MVLLCNLYVFCEWKYCDFFFKMTEKNIQIRLEIVILYFLRIKPCYFTHTVNNNILYMLQTFNPYVLFRSSHLFRFGECHVFFLIIKVNKLSTKLKKKKNFPARYF